MPAKDLHPAFSPAASGPSQHMLDIVAPVTPMSGFIPYGASKAQLEAALQRVAQQGDAAPQTLQLDG